MVTAQYPRARGQVAPLLPPRTGPRHPVVVAGRPGLPDVDRGPARGRPDPPVEAVVVPARLHAQPPGLRGPQGVAGGAPAARLRRTSLTASSSESRSSPARSIPESFS